tara:strand:- start:110 stop:382 length:273 start_codon:yes stop_codon:yes gene_type:complete
MTSHKELKKVPTYSESESDSDDDDIDIDNHMKQMQEEYEKLGDKGFYKKYKMYGGYMRSIDYHETKELIFFYDSMKPHKDINGCLTFKKN